MKRVLAYLRPHVWRMVLQFTVKFSGTIAELLLPWMLSHILDDVVITGDRNLVLAWGLLMVLCAVAVVVCNVSANRMSTRISRDFVRVMRHDLFAKVTYLSSRQVDGFTISSLISRLSSDSYNVYQMVDRMQRLGVRAPILLLGGVVMSFALEPVLALVLICMLPVLAFVVFYISRHGISLYTKAQLVLDSMVSKVQESMAGIRVIKALSKTEYEMGQFDSINSELSRRERSAGMLMAATGPSMNLLLNLGLTLVVVVGAYRVNAGLSLPGAIIGFLSYFTIILNAVMMVSRMFTMYSKGAASARRIDEVMSAPSEPNLLELPSRPSEYHIEFCDVSFSYNKIEQNVSHISFALHRGETLGIIGPTGSGKSTIINLLLRLYDPDEGEIYINGQRIESIPSQVLHTMFGVVFQNDFLYTDEIYENIDFGRELTKEEIETAAKLAQAEFIKEKEGGFSHRLAVKGANLSGGQKQRLLIARALASDPDILLFDDSSSALDYKTDANLRRALFSEFSGVTTVIVAQRISSIMHADHIMMLEDGKVIGYGSHEELLESCPGYREIYDAQMGEGGAALL